VGISRSISSPARIGLWLAAALVVAALIAMQAHPARAGGTGQILYGADGAGGNASTNLYVLDPTTGAIVTTVGPIGFAVTGLAVHPTTGILYGTTGNASPVEPGALITIDTTTGAGTLVGQLVPGNETAADITFGSNGTLYGWLEANTDDLVTIDLTTGAATVVGDAGLSTAGAALAGSGNPLTLAGSGDGGLLHQIDTGTGAATPTVTLDGTTDTEISASDFHSGGTLFAVRLDTDPPRPAELVTINTTTGAITVIGSTVNRLDAIAFGLAAPGPSVVPSVPNAATDEPMTDPLSGVLWILGMAIVVGAVGLTVRTLAAVRNR
jgi:hypothetical protein